MSSSAAADAGATLSAVLSSPPPVELRSADRRLFATKKKVLKRLLPPTMGSSGPSDSLLPTKVRSAREKSGPSSSPDGTAAAAAAAGASSSSPAPKAPKLYDQSWPLLPRSSELEDFDESNLLYRRRLLVARGTLSPVVDPVPVAQDGSPTPLGSVPREARSGGFVQPSFYAVRRRESPTRLPSNHMTFWHRHPDEAPRSTRLGLGVMSFELPGGGEGEGGGATTTDAEFVMNRIRILTTGEENDTAEYDNNLLDEQQQIKLDGASSEVAGLPEAAAAAAAAAVTATTTTAAATETATETSAITSTALDLLPPVPAANNPSFSLSAPFAGSRVLPPLSSPDLSLEAACVLSLVESSTRSADLYTSIGVSVLSAVLTSASLLPQHQPPGPSPTKRDQRILGQYDALQYQGPMTPRTRLHTFLMFPFSRDSHEAASSIQHLFQRHKRRRGRSATILQACYRMAVAHREFGLNVVRWRRAIKTMQISLRGWLKVVRLKHNAIVTKEAIVAEIIKSLGEEAYMEEKRFQFCRYAFLCLLYRYRWKRRIKKRRHRRKVLESACAIRMQKTVRRYLVRCMTSHWRDSHIIIRRSFRLYFFRKYKKQIRKIIGCWKNNMLRHYIKLIQKRARGMIQRARAFAKKFNVVNKEAVRAAGELDAVRQVLTDVDVQLEKYLKTAKGKKEHHERAKLCAKIYKKNRAEGKLAAKTWDEKLALVAQSWLAMFEIPDPNDRLKTDGFVDFVSVRHAFGALYLGDKLLLETPEIEDMLAELDIFKVGHVRTELIVGWLKHRVAEKKQLTKTEPPKNFVAKVRRAVKLWGARVSVSTSNGLYLSAAKRSMVEEERKRQFLKVVEAYRLQDGGKPRIVCQGCLRPYPVWTLAAQRHVKSGGCCLRPSLFLPNGDFGERHFHDGMPNEERSVVCRVRVKK